MNYIYILIAISALLCYIRKSYTTFLLLYFALMTKIYMFDTISEVSAFGEDLGMLISILLIPIICIDKSYIYRFKSNIFTIYIYIYIIFYIVEFLITVHLGYDNYTDAFKVIRKSFIFLSFFIFATIPTDSIMSFAKIAFGITSIQCVFFIMQLWDVSILRGYDQEQFSQNSCYTNTPTLLHYLVFVIPFMKCSTKLKVFLFVLFLVVIFMSRIRGNIIALFVAFSYLIIKQKPTKKTLVYVLLILFMIPIAIKVIDNKSMIGRADVVSDITNVADRKFSYSQYDHSNGTFAFRIAMLSERWNYLINNKQYMILGVGAIHEDSPNCYNRFNFYLGTNNEERYWGQCLIESGDITWVPILLRYGIAGVVVHLVFFVIIFFEANRRKDRLICVCAIIIFYFIRSFDGSFFESYVELWSMSILMSLLCRKSIEK